MGLKENLNRIWLEIDAALKKNGRSRQDLHLIAVSKTRSLAEIKELYDLGQLDFGENKAQELRDKQPNLPNDIRWHMIGHLQSNKLKYVVGKCALIHSVDSLKLAREINEFAQKHQVSANILLQLDIARDGKKQGFVEKEINAAIEEIQTFSHVQVHGLMTIAPFGLSTDENRQIFQRIKQISVDIQAKNYDNVNMNVLSMGMSNDFALAIEEGATHLRIGTAIFGERDY
ncbi:YggS family pyridoxal phosphate-dependent enzyme [Clostridiales bacterium COT073_COT-073]|nr:YggS family pyridoxal phosphate-dependent enzyme [Clostridiales bacterium COT073_COT-073]